MTTAEQTRQSTRVFISYKRNVEPDHVFAVRAFETFQQLCHTVFIDRTLTIGQEWTKEIESQVRACLTLSDLLEPQVQKLNSCT
jgi:hypothetical protein